MVKRILIMAGAIGLMALALIPFRLEVGGLAFGGEDVDRKRMGYCFDVAASPDASRLFVAPGHRGLHVLDLEEGKLHYVTTHYDDGYYRNLKLRDGRAYVADSRRGLLVLDVSGDSPATTWIEPDGMAGGIHLQDDLAFVAAFEEGLEIYDIADPDAPAVVGTLATPGHAWDVWVGDGFAYVADFNAGLTVIDVSSPRDPRYVTAVTWVSQYQTAEIVRGEGSVVFVAAGPVGLVIVDVSDPLHPAVASHYRPARHGAAERLAVRDGLVYVATGGQIDLQVGRFSLELATTTQTGLHVVDASDPYHPVLLGQAFFLGWVEGVQLSGDHACVANTWTGVRSIDLRDPSKPVVLDAWNALPSSDAQAVPPSLDDAYLYAQSRQRGGNER